VTRYLEIQVQGVLAWLGPPSSSPAQRVFSGLLRLPRSAPLVAATLAEQFGMDLEDFSRALFELNRSRSLRVSDEAHDHSAQFHADFALLLEDLRDLGADRPELMLATTDGLCLARQGLSDEICLRQAAICHRGPSPEFPCVIPLHVSSRTIHLCSTQDIDASSDALLRLTRRLIGLQAV
jgi:hypothetical protein